MKLTGDSSDDCGENGGDEKKRRGVSPPLRLGHDDSMVVEWVVLLLLLHVVHAYSCVGRCLLAKTSSPSEGWLHSALLGGSCKHSVQKAPQTF